MKIEYLTGGLFGKYGAKPKMTQDELVAVGKNIAKNAVLETMLPNFCDLYADIWRQLAGKTIGLHPIDDANSACLFTIDAAQCLIFDCPNSYIIDSLKTSASNSQSSDIYSNIAHALFHSKNLLKLFDGGTVLIPIHLMEYPTSQEGVDIFYKNYFKGALTSSMHVDNLLWLNFTLTDELKKTADAVVSIAAKALENSVFKEKIKAPKAAKFVFINNFVSIFKSYYARPVNYSLSSVKSVMENTWKVKVENTGYGSDSKAFYDSVFCNHDNTNMINLEKICSLQMSNGLENNNSLAYNPFAYSYNGYIKYLIFNDNDQDIDANIKMLESAKQNIKDYLYVYDNSQASIKKTIVQTLFASIPAFINADKMCDYMSKLKSLNITISKVQIPRMTTYDYCGNKRVSSYDGIYYNRTYIRNLNDFLKVYTFDDAVDFMKSVNSPNGSVAKIKSIDSNCVAPYFDCPDGTILSKTCKDNVIGTKIFDKFKGYDGSSDKNLTDSLLKSQSIYSWSFQVKTITKQQRDVYAFSTKDPAHIQQLKKILSDNHVFDGKYKAKLEQETVAAWIEALNKLASQNPQFTADGYLLIGDYTAGGVQNKSNLEFKFCGMTVKKNKLTLNFEYSIKLLAASGANDNWDPTKTGQRADGKTYKYFGNKKFKVVTTI